jgi:hypothetical protein
VSLAVCYKLSDETVTNCNMAALLDYYFLFNWLEDDLKNNKCCNIRIDIFKSWCCFMVCVTGGYERVLKSVFLSHSWTLWLAVLE